MRDCYGKYPKSNGFPCRLCEYYQKCRSFNINELVKDRKQKYEEIQKLKKEMLEINKQIQELCKHELILLKTTLFEEQEYMCVRCKKFLDEIPDGSRIVTLDELEKMPKEERIEYI